ncbi:MAG TPA: NADH-quinone oxidoreductase subunit C [Acidimicrobiales bacterium]|nr:NADH-quinone oxidoreductase subunit C [Acidimicrobiales bacterium]
MSSDADEGAPAPPVDQVRTGLVGSLRSHLGTAVLETEVANGDVWVRLERAAWSKAAGVLRNELGMDYFCFLSGLDWMANPGLSGEKVWDPDGGVSLDEEGGDEVAEEPAGSHHTGVAGGDSRFQVFARVYSTGEKVGITLKADLDEADPRIGSWVAVYRGADWHEREAWEMYGFTFDGHPGLRHMYLPSDFEGHPMRKDFPLLAREVKPWPGLVDVEAMPGEEAGEGEGTEG